MENIKKSKADSSNLVITNPVCANTEQVQQLCELIDDFLSDSHCADYQEMQKVLLEMFMHWAISEDHDPNQAKNYVYLSNNLMQFIMQLKERFIFLKSNSFALSDN